MTNKDNITLPREVVERVETLMKIANKWSDDVDILASTVVDLRDDLTELRTALAAEQPKPEPVALAHCPYTPPPSAHFGYVLGDHWLETAYSRVLDGESEADVLRDYGLVRITDGTVETADIHAIVDRQEALRRDAEMMQWLIDNHTAWSWNPSRYNADVIGGFAAFSTGYLGFDLKTAIRKAMQDSALQEDKT